ncbi:MAG: CHAT domain-containing protein [Caldilineaceae bacterium]|nr:CHAT domain-containing protein [Caldilineaceae bacterium]MCY4117786.1 CHAT domain-containing protein [Caldilineaceae bacterium]
MSCRYTNFDITISGDSSPHVVLATYRGLSGASTFDQDALQPVWQEYLARLGDPFRTQGEQLLSEIGSRLFTELIRGHVRDLWSQARSDLDDGGRLRVRLMLHPPAVAALPWETLHDPRRNQSFCADARISLVRTQNLVSFVARPRALEATLPLKVLLVSVETADGLAAHEESGQIRAAIEALSSGRMHLDRLDGRVTIQHLCERLEATRPDILHIIGHGNEDGLLLWADNAPALVSASTLRAALQQAECVKLVFLNACLAGQVDSSRPFAGVAHQLLQSGLPAVVAMRYEILDRSAVTFAESVYEALVSGPCRGHIDAAVSSARNSLYIRDPDRADYATPILWLNAENGRILRFEEREREQRLLSRSPVKARPQMWNSELRLEFRLAEKEAWFRSLPETISDPHLPFEYQRRRRIVGLLLRILRQAVDEQEEGKLVDIRAVQKRLETFDEERRHIQNILDHCLRRP